MNEAYTFHEAVAAIDRATLTGRAFPRALRDNHPISRLLCLDWRNEAERDQWLDYFGADHDVLSIRWAHNWHGWTVMLTAHFENDIDPATVGIEQRTPPAVADGVDDACVDASARRIHGLHRAADLDAVASAILTPDAPIDRPCAQQTRQQTHGQHTRHVGAYTRQCDGWNTPTAQNATVTR